MKKLLFIIFLIWSIPSFSQHLSYDPDLWMPDTIPVSLGNDIELYNNNIAFIKLNDREINFRWECKVGTSDTMKWSWKADRTGYYTLKVRCLIRDKMVDSTSSIIKVVKKVQSPSQNILAIGNSLTQSGYQFLFPQIQQEMNFVLKPIGTQGKDYKHEGHSGWLFDSFLNEKSPFYIDSCISFKKYIQVNNLPHPDIIRISLGINDCYLNSSHPVEKIMDNATHLVDVIYKDYPSSTIILALPPLCEATGKGWQASYKDLNNLEPYLLHMRELWKRIYGKFSNGQYKPKITVSYDGLTIDRFKGYPSNNGVHPNPYGYTQLAKGFSNTLNDFWKDKTKN